MNSKLIEQLNDARSAGTSLIAIQTPDAAVTVRMLGAAITDAPVMTWNVVDGLSGVNDPGKRLVIKMLSGKDAVSASSNPLDCLALLNEQTPEWSVTILINGALLLNEGTDRFTFAQAVWNLREPFKANNRCLILTGGTVKLPPMLQQDVIVFYEELPDDQELEAIVLNCHKLANVAEPTEKNRRKAVEALRGLAPYSAECVTAMCLYEDGADLQAMWERKRSVIESLEGLRFMKPGLTFADIGGQAEIKEYHRLLNAGPEPYSFIVFMDEIEKMLPGAGGGETDTSGGNTSKDQLGNILSTMENEKWTGQIFVGPPGGGKSLFPQALLAEFGVPGLTLDLGALKGGIVGQSEAQMRQAMATIKAIASMGAYFVATCNKLDTLPPELRRRFTDGLWFFDMPSADERAAIWPIHLATYKLTPSKEDRAGVMSETLTGAEIRNVCRTAYRTRTTLTRARQYIVPVAVSDPDKIEELRTQANDRFLSSARPGNYIRSAESARGATAPGSRRIQTAKKRSWDS